MEIKKSFSPRDIFIGLYIVVFFVYMFIGFQPAEATNARNGSIVIPSIGLSSSVTNLVLQNNELVTPDTIVGSFSNNKNKTLLIGHSSTVFGNLEKVNISDYILYNQKTYQIVEYVILPKSEISMRDILQSEEIDTIIIMTCTGENLGNYDATHRLILKAVSLT